MCQTKEHMKIVIIGAGYCGLSLALSLHEEDPDLQIVIFHKDGIDKSASSVSTGLLHSLVGKFARKSVDSEEGIKEALRLLETSEKALGKPVYKKSGILRVANYPYQIGNYKRASKKYPENEWHNDASIFHNEIKGPGLFCREGITVFSDLYVQGLKLAAEGKGIKFFQKDIQDTKELQEYDQIILAAGPGIIDFQEAKNLKVEKIKGQALIVKKPKSLDPITVSLLSKGHISLCQDPDYYQIGSTYERDFIDNKPNDKAYSLLELVAEFFHNAKDFEVVGIKSGIRLSRIGTYVPYACHLEKNVWVFGAMGSRGLIYHGALAKQLAKSVIKNPFKINAEKR